MSKNYFDEHGNYMNVENLTLGEIYKRGYEDGFKYPRRGKWTDNRNGTYTCSDCDFSGGGYLFCTKCEWKFSFGAYRILEYYNYCPHCGSRIIRQHDSDGVEFTFEVVKEGEAE